jgi:hypothetical protein
VHHQIRGLVTAHWTVNDNFRLAGDTPATVDCASSVLDWRSPSNGDCFRLDRDGHTLEGDEALWFAAGTTEPAKVQLHFAIRFEGFKHSFEDQSRRCALRALNTVVHPLSFSPGHHHACLAQVRKMPGYLGLSLPQYFNQITDAHLTSSNQIEQAQSCPVGEGRKQGDQIG